MGLTHQAVIGASKRQYTNENNTTTSSSTNCSSCEKVFTGGEDCPNCGMRSQFSKRSREVSPHRKPLGTMDMLPECQNITKKTEVLGITEHMKQDALNFVTLAEVVDAVYMGNAIGNKELTNGTCANTPKLPEYVRVTEGTNRNQTVLPESQVPSSQTLTNTNESLPKPKPGIPVRVAIRRAKSRSCFGPSKFSGHKRQPSTTNQLKGDSSSGDDEDDYSEHSDNDSSSFETDDQKGTEQDTTTTGSDEDVDSSTSGENISQSIYVRNGKNFKLYPGMRASQFPFVPPFINFCQHSEKCDCLPQEIRNILKWRLSPITPTVVRSTVTSSGFRLLKKTVEWTGQWGKHMKAVMFRAALKDYQKLNHLPATFQLGRKDKLWRNYQRFSCKFGKENFGFLPKSYILPQEMKSFKTAWDSESRGKPWIIKPPAGARGNGIRVINKWGQVPKKRSTIVQKYISKPLLINSRKFDIRLYALVTSFHPLKIYLYRDGLVRFAPVKYSQDSKRVSDRFMHLTNYSINKYCDLYTKNEDAESMEGHKWTLKSLWVFLKNEGHNVDKLWASLEDITIKTFICAEDQISTSAFNLPSRYNGYELFGLDVILDEKLKPWLLEVNISPSLHSSSPLDLAVKAPLIREVFNIVGYHFPDFISNSLKKKIVSGVGTNVKLETPVFDRRMYSNTLSAEEKSKQNSVKTNFQNRDKYIKEMLQNLTPDDLRYLIQAEDELSQCIGFKRIFPSADTHVYLKFFDGPRYYNQLYDAWEYKYANCRPNAIKTLQQMCDSRIHLQLAQNYSGKVTISTVENFKGPEETESSTTDNRKSKFPSGSLTDDEVNGNINAGCY